MSLLQKSIRPAFTLLEVVLALALSVAVMAVIGVAIQLHLNTLGRSTVDIERTQLARTLLHRIADDVRSAVRSEPFDDSGIMSVVGGTSVEDATKAAESAGLDAGALLGEATGDSSGGKSGSSSDSSKSDDATDSDSAESTTTPASTPGLYGSQYDLQIDVGRLPRPDELSTATINGNALPGDVRTVTYYLASANGAAGQTGLMRSELNRATALYQSETGDASAITENAEAVADEVSALEFRYFDGTQWLSEWDSTASAGLPMAVEISIVIDTQAVSSAATVDSETARSTLTDFDPSNVYRLVVHLPNAQLPKAESTTSEDNADKSSTPKDLGDTSGSSSSSKGAAGSSPDGAKSGGSKTGSSKSGSSKTGGK